MNNTPIYIDVSDRGCYRYDPHKINEFRMLRQICYNVGSDILGKQLCTRADVIYWDIENNNVPVTITFGD